MRPRTPYLQLRRSTSAPPDVVYEVLADLRTHLEWGGSRQLPNFRIKTLSAPAGPATVGTVFSSTGAIPMSGRHWEDRSTVTIATRPEIFEFVTEARAGDSRGAMLARYVHRYELGAADGGSTVTYTLFEDEVVNPMLRFAIPGVRTLTRLMATWMFAWGFRNLVVASARRYEASNPSAAEMRAARRKEA